MGNERGKELEASSANTTAVVSCEEVPNHLLTFLTLNLLCPFYRVELKNVNHFPVVHFLISGTPRFYKLEAIRKGLEHTWGDSVEVRLRHLFIVARFLWLLKLFVREVKEHFESQLEHLGLLFNRESVLKVCFSESCNLWIRVEEAAVPKWEYFLYMWAKLSLCFENKRCKTFVSCLSNQFILLVK